MKNELLYDKIFACWMGKNIGGTLGMPVEGCMEVLHLTRYTEEYSGAPIPNDDLDIQLVNLHALEQHGVGLGAEELSAEWLEHIYFPYDEYGYALTNMRRGLRVPLSGYYGNPFTTCMGCPIRSELWACIFPGDPQKAAEFAKRDALVDHAGGYSIDAEMFFAALESKAFVTTDKKEVIRAGLEQISADSVIAKAVEYVVNAYQNGVELLQLREEVLARFGSLNFTDATQNIAFTIMGLLYGNDFEDGMIKTVNLGYDTDCTVATLGSIYGIMYGMSYIPEKWIRPIGTSIVVSKEIVGLDYPSDIMELTKRTMKLQKALAEVPFEEIKTKDLPEKAQVFWLLNDKKNLQNVSVTVHCPVLRRGENGIVSICIENTTPADWDIAVTLSPLDESQRVLVKAHDSQTLEFNICPHSEYIQTETVEMNFTRYYMGRIWTTYSEKVVFPIASEWTVDGEKRYGENGEIRGLEKGKHMVQTTLFVGSEQPATLILATKAAVNVKMDGKHILSAAKQEAYIPAYHRAFEEQLVDCTLTAGLHTVEIEIDCEEETVLNLIPVARLNDNRKDTFYLYDVYIG